MSKPVVVIGLLGPTLDNGFNQRRWDRWRPSVSACMQSDLSIARFEILHSRTYDKLAEVVANDMRQVSPDTTVNHHHLTFKDAWDIADVYGALHEFAQQYPWQPEQEDYLIHITTGTHVAQICLFLLTETRHFPARLLQTSPGPDGRRSSVGVHSIIDLDLSRYDTLAQRFADERAAGQAVLTHGIRSQDPTFARLVERIEQVAVASTAPILLTGATGVGKTHLARRIYNLKKSRNVIDGPFVEVNCATLRGDQAMSMLFGHRKGAFTGALQDREGLLRRANGGVLFLDEIGELGLDEQAMLLRAIEDHIVVPMGADTPVLSDFQLIAGTNSQLRSDVQQGRFREDLLARIDLWSFCLPPLIERKSDIEPNIDFEIERFARDQGRRVSFNQEARTAYINFATSATAIWPGNFRDLAGSITRLATLAPAGRIDGRLVDEEIALLRQRWHASTPPDVIDELLGPAAADLDYFDRIQLREVIRVCRTTANLSEAGRTLFQASRTKRKTINDADRLVKYLARFQLDYALCQHP